MYVWMISKFYGYVYLQGGLRQLCRGSIGGGIYPVSGGLIPLSGVEICVRPKSHFIGQKRGGGNVKKLNISGLNSRIGSKVH